MNKDTNIAHKVEEAVRQTAAITPGPLTDLIAKFDAMKAEGRNVEFRMDDRTKIISIVELEEVSVDLGELVTEALSELDAELASEALAIFNEEDQAGE